MILRVTTDLDASESSGRVIDLPNVLPRELEPFIEWTDLSVPATDPSVLLGVAENSEGGVYRGFFESGVGYSRYPILDISLWNEESQLDETPAMQYPQTMLISMEPSGGWDALDYHGMKLQLAISGEEHFVDLERIGEVTTTEVGPAMLVSGLGIDGADAAGEYQMRFYPRDAGVSYPLNAQIRVEAFSELTTENLGELRWNGRIEGSLAEARSAGVYGFSVADRCGVTWTLTGASQGVSVFVTSKATGAVVARGQVDEDGNMTLAERLTSGGDYTLHVVSREGPTDYTINYERSSYPIAHYMSDTPPPSSGELKGKVVMEGAFTREHKADQYTFFLSKRTRVTFHRQGSREINYGVVPQSRKGIAATYYSDTRPHSRTLPSGLYTVKVYVWDTGVKPGGRYNLTITPEPERDPVTTTALTGRAERRAKSLMRRKSVVSRSSTPDVLANSEVLKLTVRNTRRVRIRATQSQASRMRIYDARGRVVATSRNGSKWSHAIRKRLQTGTYFVQLFSPQVDVQRYNLSIR
jgi:hypothetical protein